MKNNVVMRKNIQSVSKKALYESIMTEVSKEVKKFLNEEELNESLKKPAGLTVNQLAKECQKLIRGGYGDKIIQVSDDDEQNGFHTLWEGFYLADEDTMEYTHDFKGQSPDNFVILV